MRFILVVLTSFLFSCATSVIDKTASFSADSKNGLAIIGVESGSNIRFMLAKFDSDKKIIRAGTFGGHETLRHPGGDLRYFVLNIDPGTYVFKSYDYNYWDSSGRNNLVNICLSKGTYMFPVKAGEIIYLGDLYINALGRAPLYSPGNTDEAKIALSEYPNIQGEISRTEMEKTEFLNGRDAFGMDTVCGGYYWKDKTANSE